MKVRIFTDQDETILSGVAPDGFVRGFTQADIPNVFRAWVIMAEGFHEPMRKILIEQQLHCDGSETSFRSRLAAKVRQARMSSEVRSGKSARISASLMPEARYSKTSYTVMRKFRMHGLPAAFGGIDRNAIF
jgi:hypothetical protein